MADELLTSQEADFLRHTIGLNDRTCFESLSWWLNNDNHRNNFAANPNGTDIKVILCLVEKGLMFRGRDIPGGLVYYHASEDGIIRALREYPAPERKPRRRRAI